MLNHLFTHQLMPAVTFNREEDVLPVTEAILDGGLNVMEVTFRTEIAAKAIKMIRKQFPEMQVGAGTLLSSEQIDLALNAGAFFGLAPGLTASVVKYAAEKSFPFIPGIITPSELESALALGCRVLKLFPCDLTGGASLIKALQATYAHMGVRFIPMGGINLSNLREYTDLDIVLAAGGSWIAPGEMIAQKRYDQMLENVKRSIAITSTKNAK
ncbi:bifunctional 4-hydroxy-2-oxoglutarate aldolase/2-dehydro-3-deoxy-phosphogluconate aldolase [Chitinophaga sp. Ak27]|uniref:bifunctional 4-hydroxy-2-oxoglutarate aldolase/2-dehydro-3-deoxy-phosphogluconate aldolase n=1 Tax=Chitinophaga sp. Ak27 TaxID=2726116 RepID=UPI00145DD7D8|nr:bifunctional 4-hydroxy-2-oxoglutarate aldolase/2-dehydro-3-deoxy-phosphogluconate aldolase [Chitinophaga sp. Ak27]NLU90460.1 bifunctional 4-hydroxy-2-oxoglutarate aldolase/2-dehydro-3-deoxy-phosphogluconate aldolase [Chitinophaga sp. Ak27]